MSTRQTSDRVEQDDHIAAPFDHAFGLLEGDIADVNVLAGRFVERARDHLGSWAGNRPHHFGHFFGPLVDEQHDEIALWMILANRKSNLLQQDGLACTRRRYDQAALALADWGDEIDDASRELVAGHFEDQAFGRVKWRQIFEDGSAGLFFRPATVDQLNLHQGEVFLPFHGKADGSFDHQARTQAKPPNLAWRDLNILG